MWIKKLLIYHSTHLPWRHKPKWYLGLSVALVISAQFRIASALPPTGLTPTNLTTSGGLEIIDGSAYISNPTGIRTVSSTGDLGLIPLSHPLLGSPSSITPVAKAFDGLLYAAANFGASGFPTHAALFRLDQPFAPIVTWESAFAVGVSEDLMTFGNVQKNLFGFEATKFHLDGSTNSLTYPPGSDSTNNSTVVGWSTPSGYAAGEAGIPATAGSGPVLWNPDGEISFLNGGFGATTSLRDRRGVEGTNVGLHDFNTPVVYYGAGPPVGILDEDGRFFYDSFSNLSGYQVNVSQGNFVGIKYIDMRGEVFSALYAFYPGINPDFPNRAVPLLDIFPELASIDIDAIYDLASVDGYLYMTLSGSDGTFLFGARDPSVIPEPTGFVLALLGVATSVLRRNAPAGVRN